MAVAAMRRFELFGHANTKTDVLRVLQELGIAHIDDAGPVVQDLPEDERAGIVAGAEISDIEQTYQTVQQCLKFVDRYAELPGALEKLKQPRLPVPQQEFHSTTTHFALDLYAERVRDLEGKLSATSARIAKLEVLRDDLAAWTDMDAALEEIRPTSGVDLWLATIDTTGLRPFQRELAEASPLTHVHIVRESRPVSALVIFVARSVMEETAPIFKKYGCRTVDFEELTGTPQEARESLTAEIAELYEKLSTLEGEARALAADRPKLLILSDYYADKVASAEVEASMLYTRAAYFLRGWVPAEQEEVLTDAVHDVSPAISLTLSTPPPHEAPPVLLENGPSSPFEMITGMYGTPKYDAVDPTPHFAPWFAFFFGLCLTDAGYGIVLAIVLGWAIKTLPLEGGVRKLARVLFFGSLFTVLGGAFTGGWFGMKIEGLPSVLQGLVWIQPMVEAERALFTALGIGVIHLLLGVGIKMMHNVRRGHILDAILDQGVWMVFIVAVTPLIYTGIFNQTIDNAGLLRAAKILSIACTAIVILTGARNEPLLLRPLLGGLKLYDLVGYFGDALSYSRLLALGLATGAIGSAINLIAGQIVHAAHPVIGYAIAIPLLILGHGFNIVINVLGAFIHSMRLQFIEFFGKFFEDGGKPFRPFSQVREYVQVTPH